MRKRHREIEIVRNRERQMQKQRKRQTEKLREIKSRNMPYWHGGSLYPGGPGRLIYLK